jgi:hypothetical protein
MLVVLELLQTFAIRTTMVIFSSRSFHTVNVLSSGYRGRLSVYPKETGVEGGREQWGDCLPRVWAEKSGQCKN